MSRGVLPEIAPNILGTGNRIAGRSGSSQDIYLSKAAATYAGSDVYACVQIQRSICKDDLRQI